MKILITGGTGFIGRHLCRAFLDDGHEVVAVGTRSENRHISASGYRYVRADTRRGGPWQREVAQAQVIINLAGKTIFNRWDAAYKRVIYDSRVRTTENLVRALPSESAAVFCSASAVGYYGDRGDEVLSETAAAGTDFLARLGRDWESAALAAGEKGARVVLTRFSVVLGRDGGALKQMLPVFRMFAGGPIGSGAQWFPWIHIKDLKAAMTFVIDNDALSGPVNFCAPEPVRNRTLARALGRALNRPAVMPVPAFMVRLALGEFSQTLLGGQRAVPDKLIDHGFTFDYPDIKRALGDLL
jgi:uncharacterized protein (TIGR01777 family)